MKWLKHYSLHILLAITLCLVLVDIVLTFKPSPFLITTFNDIATPMSALVSSILLYLALKATREQNKISYSNQLVAHFDSEIQTLMQDFARPIVVETLKDFKINDHISFSNCGDKLVSYLELLQYQESYHEHLNHIDNGKTLTVKDVTFAEYYKFAAVVTAILNESRVKIIQLLTLTRRIHSSELISPSKAFFIQKLSGELADDYISANFLLKHLNHLDILIPQELYRGLPANDPVEFKPLGKDFYILFHEKLQDAIENIHKNSLL